MKKLKRIIFINWYLFEAAEWEIKGHVALLGKNGSGKSSFLDAIQYVLVGGNKSQWSPNAKVSGKRGSRTVQSYILGMIKDDEALASTDGKTEYEPREDALSRITLVFEDTKTGVPVSIGVGMSARRGAADEETEGWFILEGTELTLLDFLADDRSPRPYDELKVMFNRRSPEGPRHFFGKESKKYTEQMLTTLGTDRKPPAFNKYSRALNQSIRLGELDSPIQFIRESILDYQPLDLDKVRQSRKSYQNKLEAVERAKEQLAALEACKALFDKDIGAGIRRDCYAWAVTEFWCLYLADKSDSNDEDVLKLLETIDIEQRRLSDIEDEAQRLNADLEPLLVLLNTDQKREKKKGLEEKRERHKDAKKQSNKHLYEVKTKLGRASQIARHDTDLDTATFEVINALAKHAQSDEQGWPHNAEALDQLIAKGSKSLENASEQTFAEQMRLGALINQNETTLKDAQSQLSDAKQGRASLSRGTQSLIRALYDEGITATPACDLVEVTDKAWQPAIEGYLKNTMEALIVPPGDAKTAVAIYRRMNRRDLDGATVVNTYKVREWNYRYDMDTLPSLLKGSDELATAYLQRQMQNIKMIDSTEQLMREKRAMTKDGMFANLGGIRKIRLPDTLMLGRDAREGNKAKLEAGINELQKTVITLKRKSEQLRTLTDDIAGYRATLKDMPNTHSLTEQRISSDREIENLTKQIDAIDLGHIAELEAQEEKLRGKISVNKKARDDAKDTISRSEQKISDIEAQQKEVADKHAHWKAKRTEAEQTEYYDTQKASEHVESIETKVEAENRGLAQADIYLRSIGIAENRADNATKQQQKHREEARAEFGRYLSKHPIDEIGIETKSSHYILNIVESQIYQINEIGLVQFEKDVKEAMAHLRKLVRQDVAVRLRSQINAMKQRFDELNAELRARPFSANQIYQFKYERVQEHRDFLNFVESVDAIEAANADSLFDEHEHLNPVIERMIDEGDDVLSDYRSFYTYDIVIKDSDSGIEERLSKKAKSASGGEHRTPFYVAMGASLASAYRISRLENGETEQGFALYLADEAFEKMDRKNTTQAAKYLESIGLQLFVAAPDDAEAKLTMVVDTVLFFIREGAKAAVDISHVKPKARDLIEQAFEPPSVSIPSGETQPVGVK